MADHSSLMPTDARTYRVHRAGRWQDGFADPWMCCPQLDKPPRWQAWHFEAVGPLTRA